MIFRYVDAINFMVFEVGNQVCRIRKFVDDVPTIVKENHCQMNNVIMNIKILRLNGMMSQFS